MKGNYILTAQNQSYPKKHDKMGVWKNNQTIGKTFFLFGGKKPSRGLDGEISGKPLPALLCQLGAHYLLYMEGKLTWL